MHKTGKIQGLGILVAAELGFGQHRHLGALFSAAHPMTYRMATDCLRFLSLCLPGNIFRLPLINVSHPTDTEKTDPRTSVAAVSALITSRSPPLQCIVCEKKADFPSHYRWGYPDDRILETSGTRRIAIQQARTKRRR